MGAGTARRAERRVGRTLRGEAGRSACLHDGAAQLARFALGRVVLLHTVDVAHAEQLVLRGELARAQHLERPLHEAELAEARRVVQRRPAEHVALARAPRHRRAQLRRVGLPHQLHRQARRRGRAWSGAFFLGLHGFLKREKWGGARVDLRP